MKIVNRKLNPRGEETFDIKAEKVENIYQEIVTREADHDEDSTVCQGENKEVTAADEEKLNVKIVIRR